MAVRPSQDKDGDGSITKEEFVKWKLEEAKGDDDELFEMLTTSMLEHIGKAQAKAAAAAAE